MELSQTEINILLDGLDAHGLITPSMKSTDYEYERMVEKGLLKKVMIQSGFHPKYGYELTVEGYDVAAYADYRNKRDFYKSQNKE